MESPDWLPLAAGLLSGGAAGFCVRRANLCSFGAIESFWLSRNALRLRVYGLALAIAIAGTQALVVFGWIDLAGIRILPPVLPLAAALLGGAMFGLGMALVGTCGFGLLLRLGSGDLRALVLLLVFGAVAWSALAGALAPAGVEVFTFASLPLPAPDGPGLLGMSTPGGRSLVAGGVVIALLAWVVADPRLRQSPRLLLAGGVLGVAVVLGWAATGAIDPFANETRPPHSLSFVAPVARAIYALLLTPGSTPGLGGGSVIGAVLGAFVAAKTRDEFRWDAFDDPREMGRHMVGACLMAVGGVWASGCTIGQGLTAGSVLAPSWPFAVGGIMLGARAGIAILMEGGVAPALQHAWSARPGRAGAAKLNAGTPIEPSTPPR